MKPQWQYFNHGLSIAQRSVYIITWFVNWSFAKYKYIYMHYFKIQLHSRLLWWADNIMRSEDASKNEHGNAGCVVWHIHVLGKMYLIVDLLSIVMPHTTPRSDANRHNCVLCYFVTEHFVSVPLILILIALSAPFFLDIL